MQTYFVVLSIAGSDSCGGAGIQADIKTISALGGYAATAITSLTAQNTLGVKQIHSVNADFLEAQIEAVMSDLPVVAVKIGMVNTAKNVEIIAKMLHKYKPKHIVVDPVMISTSGSQLSDNECIKAMEEQLFPLAEVLTPNLHEAEALAGFPIKTKEDILNAIATISKRYNPFALLLKGGHLESDHKVDWLKIRESELLLSFPHKTIETNNLHGTGCSLSSAIATFLTYPDMDVPQATATAIEYVQNAINAGKDIFAGHGNGAINHFFDPKKMKINQLSQNFQ
ncbi:MAG: bifunctional hydroxymethylpyrimidine kinase/phosphomethylpyrimidine kinase [Bacteroidales bacterium]|jgi:hydroxymethylpyrimidine/phosphomethylpyrimidine kinase|nr:bifunctional hydroxymethylpyrimidine kinase/phosphomethylpyrimidine kinase [Bacteroidales bacterium]